MMVVYNLVTVILLIQLRTCFSDVSFLTTSKEISHLIESGKSQYSIINERGNNPRYGLCWRNAVSYLHDGCRGLTEHVQSDIALKFTDCFLRMSGHESYECERLTGLLRKECMQAMSDRAFNVYTEFYTHTQNICFFLQSHVWHEETEKTIDRLSSSSAKVSKQLEEAEEMQTTIYEHQKESMSVQLELLENSLSLREVLQESRRNLLDIMHEFRTSTLEQKMLLFDVFDRVSSLQGWMVGEISWLDTTVFYVSSFIISYIITATPRTAGARFFIFVSLTVNVVVERIICVNFIADGVDQLESLNESLSWCIWFCRRILIIVCIIMLCISVYRYCDYNVINNKLLIQIQDQNLKLLNYLEKIKTWVDISESSNRKENMSETEKFDRLQFDSMNRINDTINNPLDINSAILSSSSLNSPSLKNSTPKVALLRKTEQCISSTLLRTEAFPLLHRPSMTDRSASPSPSSASTRTVGSRSSYHNTSRRRPVVDLESSNSSQRYNLRNQRVASPGIGYIV